MKKRTQYLAGFVIALILFISNPKYRHHKDTISDNIVENVEDGILKDFSKILVSESVNNFNVFTYSNFFLFSITTFKIGNDLGISSFGLLNIVFVFDDAMKNVISSNISNFKDSLKNEYEKSKLKDKEAMEWIKKKIEADKKKDKEAMESIKDLF